jgi:hypothetical protein
MNHDRIEELEARISACPGWRLGRELSGLARSYKVFLGNDAELRDYLRRHSELPTVLELWSVQNREGFERFLDEVDRLLHTTTSLAQGRSGITPAASGKSTHRSSKRLARSTRDASR